MKTKIKYQDKEDRIVLFCCLTLSLVIGYIAAVRDGPGVGGEGKSPVSEVSAPEHSRLCGGNIALLIE